MKLSITTDISSFKQLLVNLRVKVPQATVAGMDAAMRDFEDDCLMKPPAVPREKGHLADSHEILPTKRLGNEIIGTLKVSTPYAASLHEGISRWGTPYKFKTPGTGAKWVQSKLLRYGQKYIDTVIRVARKAI
jgi:hypothetical protein